MNEFMFRFEVAAPVQAVSDFHDNTTVLKELSPPLMFVQVHEFEPMGEGSLAKFTLWLGPIPLHWVARHENVSVEGFTDVQISGPMASWRHTHGFAPAGPNHTHVTEHIRYEHPSGPRGLLTRLLFNKAALFFLFSYRKFVTRQALRKIQPVTAQD